MSDKGCDVTNGRWTLVVDMLGDLLVGFLGLGVGPFFYKTYMATTACNVGFRSTALDGQIRQSCQQTVNSGTSRNAKLTVSSPTCLDIEIFSQQPTLLQAKT